MATYSSAKEYQLVAQAALERHFRHVQREWSIANGATDALATDIRRYAPRVDIAVGPFSTEPGRNLGIAPDRLQPAALRAKIAHREPNPNPRCLLAIEVVFSGSSKHVMGDFLNASALGFYGVVVGSDDMMSKIRRIERYVEALADLEKLPRLFCNFIALSTAEFDELLA